MLKFRQFSFRYLTKGIVCFLFLMSSLHALEKAPVELKLVPGGIKGGHVYAGLLLTIPNDWHVYAPTPAGKEGAGFEPTVTSEGSSNLKDSKILWPVPHKTEVQGLLSYVYEGKTLIPIELTAQNIHEPVTLNLKVSLLACSSLCIPIEENLSIVLKPGDKVDHVFTAAKNWEKSYQGLSLGSLLLIALLGGFILNFMPCVLPVLSLKIMSLIKQSKQNHMKHARQGFLITGLGILASFLLLALLTVSLKESGEAFGWGIHFQNPHFLLFVFLVLIAFSASLLGIFEIDLPAGLGDWIVTHEGKGRIKDFLSGIFATLLATPCSAPFVGTALSFALARDTQEIFLVFLCLGFGFAFPYFLVASLPQRFLILPKPGRWMVWIQIFLGIILALTAVWIGWVLSFHLPLWALLLSTFLALFALSLFWIKHHIKPSLKAWLFAGPIFLIAWGLSWELLSDKSPPPHKPSGTSATLDIWQPFEPSAIESLVAQGKIVFVDVTAEWCVTCAVNKALVLSNPHITSLLCHSNVVAMKADWTKQDPRITEFLQEHGRYGIPFNIVFGPNNAQGIALPEIISIGGVKDAFEQAGLSPPKSEVSK